ncbi:phospholipase A2 inhibitor subunit gamma B-like [Trachemys scripta elegans]|uniref:phospholipase A2 inhibitor subunit gamma B-like n=1 Tax=Trachemys scripta elegans TaxID=31138 RepID=UPI001556E161|nr:phospholipase A2 inhibitor subunit gamma B-like [Trachemys scripta elegans]
MEASLVICILAALLATGTCLQCEVCNGPGNNCTGSMETCPAGQDSCAIFLTEVISGAEGMKSQSFLKGCVPSSDCKVGTISMNFGYGMATRTSVVCCVGDACRTTTVTMPPADTKPNGRSCRGCFPSSQGPCKEGTIACTGPETHCIDLAGTVTISGSQVQTIMKGCASESVCANIKVGSGTFTGISADLTTAKCTAASGAAGVTPGPAGLLLPALAGLLLLKLLS